MAIILGIVTLNCSAAEVRDANSLESVENVDSGDENFRDLQSQRENMLSLYQKGLLSEFSRIVDTACDYLARLRLITDNGEMIIKSRTKKIQNIQSLFTDEDAKSLFYSIILAKIDDPYLKYHLYQIFENRKCLTISTNNNNSIDRQTKRNEKFNKSRFHSWGGKRSSSMLLKRDNGPPKVVQRAPFNPWAGRR